MLKLEVVVKLEVWVALSHIVFMLSIVYMLDPVCLAKDSFQFVNGSRKEECENSSMEFHSYLYA